MITCFQDLNAVDYPLEMTVYSLMAFTKNKWWSLGNQDWSQFVSEGLFLSDCLQCVQQQDEQEVQ